MRIFVRACYSIHIFMKRKKLEKKLIDLGCSFCRNGSNHDIWIYENGRKFPFARHPDINEITAKSMIKRAQENREL